MCCDVDNFVIMSADALHGGIFDASVRFFLKDFRDESRVTRPAGNFTDKKRCPEFIVILKMTSFPVPIKCSTK
jgi:hypothetical protein